MRLTGPGRDHKNRWCFRCETWRDMEPWNIVDNGCRCRTCGYVVNEFLYMLECSVCGRMCEGLTDDNGRLGCSYECAYKIGHVTRATMIKLGKLKEEP